MSPNHLFQYSVVSALMDGVAETGITLLELLAYGDHGLGTFRRMVGEMIILDGVIYDMKPDGSVVALDSDACAKQSAPFAMITHFEPTATALKQIPSKDSLTETLSQLLPGTKNHYLAYRVEGIFKSVTVRTVGGQQSPGESLAELGKRQASHTFNDIEGTIIGFRSPAFMQGISVAGDHLHFLAANRESGGHVLALEGDGDLEINAARIAAFNLQFPSEDNAFNQAKLVRDDEGIAAVEG
ncbi:alpha-acetolactate decarboxylase [Fusarium austroafricanum]|uniref:Alpha-acetolactate decarboxylase n=1 Tax=Fusarium austroafricanum TaxID=2364996 RepID=A0A8H4P2U8_9HYPO|nr:alpha-acetolactate decarboxylase [Fusarium austroafricanum]